VAWIDPRSNHQAATSVGADVEKVVALVVATVNVAAVRSLAGAVAHPVVK
jgi:hypothetical protein